MIIGIIMIIGIMMFPMIIRTIILTLASATRISAIVLVTVGAPPADLRGTALGAGDIFVADQSALGGQGAVIRIDPANGTQKSIAAGNLLTHPAGIAVDRDGRIFVAVPQKPGRIVKVDALTGAQESVSSGGLFSCPTGVASLANADLIVADPCAKMIIRIYHRTGGQKAVSSGGKFGFPQNVRVATDGSIVVADRDALGGTGAIIRLDAKTGVQTVVSSGENLFNPTDLALDAEGKLLIADFNSFACGPGGYTGAGAGAILRLDRSAGAVSRADARLASQSLVSCDHLFQSQGPYGIATEGDGKILVTATTGDASPAGAPPRTPTSSYSYGVIGQIIRIDPTTGAQNSLSSAGLLAAPIGIAVLRR
jgi:streptogramin lyase